MSQFKRLRSLALSPESLPVRTVEFNDNWLGLFRFVTFISASFVALTEPSESPFG
jgi:hypothetical protein